MVGGQMYKLILLLFLIGCGKPLIPDNIKIDVPEEYRVKHDIEWQLDFARNYCQVLATTNEQLNECLNDFLRDIVKE